ncbi:MAG: NAD(P)/FAD-dependent oxidoreductase [Burkholderiaceae bacterium]
MGTPILIAGGGVIGSSTAYYLARAGVPVTVVEPDPTYEFAATPRAVGGIRFQHGLEENVRMSQFGAEVYRNFSQHVQGGPVEFDPAFRQVGYLFMVDGREQIDSLERCAQMQRGLGVEVHMLDRADLERRFPSFDFSRADAGALSPEDGQIDPNAALMGYRRAAQALGAVYVQDRVAAIDCERNRVTGVRLASGRTIAADTVLNATNCWASEVCAMVGMKVPIAPLRRQQFFFKAQAAIEPIPVMREMSGFALRPERDGYLVAVTRFKEARGFNWNLEHELFEEELWPALVERSSKFEAIKVQNGWVGHYDMCELDGNPIIGPFEGGVQGFHVAAGFSGHGLQHAPAVGRGLAELFTHGRYLSLDLSAFSYRRVIDQRPLIDQGPKA